MRHRNLNKHFGRNSSQRKELIETLARNTIIYTKIKTTLPKAKEASKLVDKLVTLGKKQTVQARRMAFAVLQDRSLVSRLFNQIAPLFKERNGGYTRVIRADNRRGDGAQMAILEFTQKPEAIIKKRSVKDKKPKSEDMVTPKGPEKKPDEKKPIASKTGEDKSKSDVKKPSTQKNDFLGKIRSIFRKGKDRK